MRSEDQMISLILKVAEGNERVRAVLMNGSRANKKIPKDRFQDFDIVYVVNEIESFTSNKKWIDVFGERIILQMPDEMAFGNTSHDNSFHFLMLFKDGNRIDLTLFPLNEIQDKFKPDSLTTLLFDKDDLFENLPAASDKDFIIVRPEEKEFADCCNEFWWMSTNVAKGLWRNEITYAKDIFEIYVRVMFLKMIEWHAGIKTNFSVSFGKSGKYMKSYISAELYQKILSTYPDSKADNIWKSLFLMTEIFSELAGNNAASMHFNYNTGEQNKVTEYLKEVYTLSQKKCS